MSVLDRSPIMSESKVLAALETAAKESGNTVALEKIRAALAGDVDAIAEVADAIATKFAAEPPHPDTPEGEEYERVVSQEPRITPDNLCPPEPVQSVTYIPEPHDSRCRYWAKVLTCEDALPAPADVKGANDIPGEYLRQGEEIELFEGDCILEGEANHHSKPRGWTYSVGVVVNGQLCWPPFKNPGVKDFLRAKGDKGGLEGAGDVAAMVRYLRARDGGFKS